MSNLWEADLGALRRLSRIAKGGEAERPKGVRWAQLYRLEEHGLASRRVVTPSRGTARRVLYTLWRVTEQGRLILASPAPAAMLGVPVARPHTEVADAGA